MLEVDSDPLRETRIHYGKHGSTTGNTDPLRETLFEKKL